jgi:ATP-dependent exoDNAse (exonuclease V) alpha subunit
MNKDKTTIVPVIDFNADFQRAMDAMEKSDGHVFITGRAGTGKSTLLQYFRTHTAKKIVVLAPTGVAAVNVSGQTIHSFFKFKPDITLDKVKMVGGRDASGAERRNLYQMLDAMVIDEISMARADLVDCIDKFLRLNGPRSGMPFGGIQLIMFGDLYQLPPVVAGAERELFRTIYGSPYFFDAMVFRGLAFECIELEKIYRQSDERFIALLNAIRNRSATEAHLKALNKRYAAKDDGNEKTMRLAGGASGELAVHLTTTNSAAEEENRIRLERLPGKATIFRGEVSGKFERKSLPTAEDIFIKPDAQVMLLNNESSGKWVNGTMGRVVAVPSDGKKNKRVRYDDDANDAAPIVVRLETGREVDVSPNEWDMFEYSLDKKTGALTTETVGSFRQYPLKLAWAITIHKSQGKTFDRVVIDLGRGTFVHGQLYVALSRCRTLEGITLRQPLRLGHIMSDWRVSKFMTGLQYAKAAESLSEEKKITTIKDLIAAGGRKHPLEIVYLKPNDEKSRRVIEPLRLGVMEFQGKKFLGVEAFCRTRGEERTFRVDRILEMREMEK